MTSTSYKLQFTQSALAEWRRLDGSLRQQFKKKIAERLKHPRVPASALQGLSHCYKIKLRQSGYRLVYEVDDEVITVTVIAIGRRDRKQVYKSALARLEKKSDE